MARRVYLCGCAQYGDIVYPCKDHRADGGIVGKGDWDVSQPRPTDKNNETVDRIDETTGLRVADYKGPKLGIGGAPTRASTMPEEAAERKRFPVASGVMDYFPDALVAVANVSWQGNEQHNPGQPLHWARGKSMDEDDAMIRHFLQRGTTDSDGIRHTAKMVWRALAMLQKEIEKEKATD